MRIAVFSDIHGNPYACAAVLQAIDDDGPFDHVVAAGDLCVGGSDPARCVNLLRAANVSAVYGNHDEFIYAPDKVPGDELHRGLWKDLKPVALWALDRLNPEQVEWLRQLPFELRFSPTGDPTDDLLVVHANPKNVEDMIYPTPTEQEKLWGEIRQPDEDPGLATLLEEVTAAVVAYGHFHYTSQRKWRNLTLVNISPCSLPSVDHDPRARYTVFTWNAELNQWAISHRWVQFDYKQIIPSLLASGIPDFAVQFARRVAAD
jgi:predicted phosphodiesterase